MNYIDQSSFELNFRVRNADFDVDGIQILKSDKAHTEIGTISASIIGASHIISVHKNNKLIIKEMLSCVDHKISGVEKLNISGDILESNLSLDNSCYKTKIIRKKISEARAEINSFTLKNSSIQPIFLEYEFPMNEDYEYAPKTSIEVVYKSLEHVIIRTMHLYPNEDSVVFSESYFE